MNDSEIYSHCANVKNAGDKRSAGVRWIDAKLLENHRHERSNQNPAGHSDKQRTADDKSEGWIDAVKHPAHQSRGHSAKDAEQHSNTSFVKDMLDYHAPGQFFHARTAQSYASALGSNGACDAGKERHERCGGDSLLNDIVEVRNH